MPGSRHCRILLVDDDIVDREAVVRALEPGEDGFEVIEAESASAGFVQINKGNWDCVILDYRLPEGDAFSLFPELFRGSCAHRPPVVLLTGLGDERLATDALKGGAQDYLSKKDLSSQTLRAAILNATESARTARDREDDVQQLRHRSMHDALTGLPNRALFDDRLDQQIQLASRLGEPFAVMMLDLDRFKSVNDEHGHGAGDRVLKVVAERLWASVRDSDSVARIGGDEFALILVTAKHRHGARVVAEKLSEAIAQPIEFEGTILDVGTSIGTAMWPEDGREKSGLLHQADSAMYVAKRAARIPPVLSESPEAVSEHTAAIARQVRGGTDLGKIRLFHQPRVCLDSCRLHSRQSLVRWQHPDFGFVPLERGIDGEERDPRLWPLARLLLEHALESFRTWREADIALRVAIDLPAVLLGQPEFPRLIERRLDHHALPPEALTIEVSETGLTGRRDAVAAAMARLSSAGVRLAVTDFASGWACVGYLDELPVKQVNLSRRFTEMALEAPSPPSCLRSILALAHKRRIDVVADAIDSDEAWRVMAGIGCTAGQGTRFTAPLRASRCLDWCKNWQASNKQASESADEELSKNERQPEPERARRAQACH